MTKAEAPLPINENPNFVPEFWRYYRENHERIMNSPHRRNFEIVPTESGDLAFLQANKDPFLLSQYLPQGVSFEEGTEFLFSSRTNKVYYSMEFLKFRGGALSLIHEIGHAHKHTGTNINLAISTLASLPRFFALNTIKKAAPLFGKSYNEFSYMDFSPQWLQQKLHRARADNEAFAWQETMPMVETLETAGFNVVGEFGSVAAVEEYINFALLSYDNFAHQANYILKFYFPYFWKNISNESFYAPKREEILPLLSRISIFDR